MPLPYYYELSESKKRLYRKSDAIKRIPLPRMPDLHVAVAALKQSLETGRRRDVEKWASRIGQQVCESLKIEPLTVKISSRRPSNAKEELQGLYERTEGEQAVLTVWMKTAAKGRVVAFKSFIRTVLHELCHHIDFTYFGFGDSLHTEGFFARESDIYKEIVPEKLQRKAISGKKPAPVKHAEAEQMTLF